MKLPKYWRNFIILAVLKCGPVESADKCNQCLKNGIACLDHVRFATCYKDTLTENITRCPANTVCTADTQICLELTPGIEPICYENKCGTCEYTNGRFACLDETSYGFCYGGMEPNIGSVRVCPLDYVCDYNSPHICVSKEIATPSCIPANETPPTENPPTTMDQSDGTDFTTTSESEITETTTDGSVTTNDPTNLTTIETTPTDPNSLCANMQRTGYFRPVHDVTCKEYIYCYLLAGQYLGQKYICAGYFNDSVEKCQNEKPADC